MASDGAEVDFWEDEEAERDEGNSIRYSGTDFINEGLDGRGGAVDLGDSRRNWYDLHKAASNMACKVGLNAKQDNCRLFT